MQDIFDMVWRLHLNIKILKFEGNPFNIHDAEIKTFHSYQLRLRADYFKLCKTVYVSPQ